MPMMVDFTMKYLIAAFILCVAGCRAEKVGPAPSPVLPRDCVGGLTRVIPGSFRRAYEECRGQGEICVFTCPPNHLYNSEADFPGCYQLWQVRQCKEEELPACEVEQQVTPYPNTCRLYTRCVQGRRHIEWCPDGTGFDPATGQCDKNGCQEPDCSHW